MARPGTILVIDDEEIMREILGALPTPEGYEVRLATNGAEGLELARAMPFDAAIVEVVVKMVDACGFGGFDNFWVFAGGLTDVEVHLSVTDTWSGEVVRHDNAQGQPFPTLLQTGRLRVCSAKP